MDLFLRAGAHVDVHVLLLDDLFALFGIEQVRWFRPQDSDHIPFSRLDGHPMSQQDLIPPAAQRLELDESFLRDQCDHEADLVHVPGHHHARALGVAHVFADKAAHLVLLNDGHAFHVLAHDRSNVALIARYATCFGDLF